MTATVTVMVCLRLLNRGASTLKFLCYEPIILDFKESDYGMSWVFILHMKSEYPGMIYQLWVGLLYTLLLQLLKKRL